MKAFPFSVVSGVVTVAYSAACFFHFSQPFWGFTALSVGALVTFYPLYFERQRAEAVHDALVAQYLRNTVPNRRTNSVYGRKLREILETLEAIERGHVHLSSSELGAFAEQRLMEKVATGRPIRYWATHLVDSERSCGIWGDPHSTYPWHRSYADRQRLLLDGDGEVVRLFIFDRTWLTANLQRCKEMIQNHREIFDGARKPVVTLASVPRRGEGLDRGELSIIDSVEVFLWIRSADPQSTGYDYGEYITNSDEVADIALRWTRHRENAFAPDEFFQLAEEGRL